MKDDLQPSEREVRAVAVGNGSLVASLAHLYQQSESGSGLGHFFLVHHSDIVASERKKQRKTDLESGDARVPCLLIPLRVEPSNPRWARETCASSRRR